MATRGEIRAVFADPQLDGMETLYEAIGEMMWGIEDDLTIHSFERCKPPSNSAY